MDYGNLVYPQQVKHYKGKTREMYFTKDGFVANIATNRLSAFDHVFDVEVPYKGAVLNLISSYFLKATSSIVPNWYRSCPNSVTSVGIAGTIIPYEIIVRGYLAGSAWRLYKKGVREMGGVTLPEGMKENDKLPKIIITPTTKSDEHDVDISREEILSQDFVSESEYSLIEDYAIKLFKHGTKMAEEVGLIFVDTKYEFMKVGNTIMLADEANTPDSSRYFYLKGYEEKQKKGQSQIQLSKEFFREWLMGRGYGEEQAKNGVKLPVVDKDVINALSKRYIELYETITGNKFPYNEAEKTKDSNYVFLTSRLAVHKIRCGDCKPLVGIVMGSDSDLPIMDETAFFLEEMGICYELTIASAHRTPERMKEYAETAQDRGLKVIVAGAGGAAHLPGMISGGTVLPVIGVPIKSSNSMDGWDSVLSILQMPAGVPTFTMALNGSRNAGIAAAEILGAFDQQLGKKMLQFKQDLKNKVLKTVEKVRERGYPNYFDK